MSINTELRDTVESLLDGRFICYVSAPDSFRQLNDPAFARQVSEALAPLGRSLSCVGEADSPEAFFAAMINLEDTRDQQHARRSLTTIRDQIAPCIDFFRLLDQAGGNNLSLVAGGELPFAKLLDAIESHEPYRDQLRDLSGLKLFDSSRNAKDSGDRLNRVLKVMQDEGYLVRRTSESSVYVFTGKLAYLQQILGWLADHHDCAIDETNHDGASSTQGGLGL